MCLKYRSHLVIISPWWVFGINSSFTNASKMFGLYVPPPVKLILVCNLLNVHWLLSGNDRLCHVYYMHMH